MANSQSPWGGNDNDGKSPWDGEASPEIEVLFKKSQDKVRRIMTGGKKTSGGFKFSAWGIVALAVGLWALTGFDLLALLTFGNAVAYRALLTLAGVGALWLLFWLIAFRPTHELR